MNTPRIPYSERLKDPRWQRKRLEVLKRDDFKCLDCGASDKTLSVHHCLYLAGREPWQYPNEELRTLCGDCHEKRHSLEHDVCLEFKRFMATKSGDELSEIMCCLLSGEAVVTCAQVT